MRSDLHWWTCMIEGGLIVFAMLFCCTSCTVIHGNAQAGTYTLATVGGDVTGYAQTAEGVTAEKLDNSTSFREGNSTLRQAVWAGAAKSVANGLSKAWSGVAKSKEVTARAATAESAATERAAIAAEVEKTAILNSVE